MSSINPHVARLLIYPIKSLDQVDCDRVIILKSGALEGDRTWAIFAQDGSFVNGKRNNKIYALRSEFDLKTNTVSLRIQGTDQTATFNLRESCGALCNWLEEYFGFPVEIKQDLNLGFPDDTLSPGPTIISTATLKAIASWYPELNTADIRRRFRANIEIAGVPAFWEDQLFTTPEATVKFKVGDVNFMGVNPCSRCKVITRDPQTGNPYPKFQQIFIAQRKITLPQWTYRVQFNHFFRLAVNTRLSPREAGKVINIEDKVTIN